MEPWQSWTAVILGGGIVYYYYSTQGNARARAGRAGGTRTPSIGHKTHTATTSQKRDNNKNKQLQDESGNSDVSGNDARKTASGESSAVSTKAKRKLKKQNVEKTDTPKVGAPAIVSSDPISGGDEPEEDLDNKEFARQLTGLKSGASLAPPAKAGNRQKTVKTSRINGSASHPSPAEAAQSTASSTAGADGDDDLSPAVSPAFGATTVEHSTSVDVSDMLEAPAPGPSVLRVLPSIEPARVPKTKPQKVQQPEETKKQRQNRRKAEEKKAAREAEEKARRGLLEKQLRTAREAEGRPAKNGLGGVSKPPATSAWAAADRSHNPDTGSPATPTNGSNVPLLDTFEPQQVNGSHKSATPAGNKNWQRDLPSEEEQMRILTEGPDAGWSTVAKAKKGKKRAAEANGSTTGNESSENGDATQAVGGSLNAPTTSTQTPQLADSDWAVV